MEYARKEAKDRAKAAWITWARSCIALGKETIKKKMKNTKKRKRWQWDKKLCMFVCFAVGRDPDDNNYFENNEPNKESDAWGDWCKRASEMGWLRDKDEDDVEDQLKAEECEDVAEWDMIVDIPFHVKKQLADNDQFHEKVTHSSENQWVYMSRAHYIYIYIYII